MRAILALLTAVTLLAGCVEELPPAGTYKEAVIASGGDATAGWQVTYKPSRTERRNAGREMVICPTQDLLWKYIDWGRTDECWVGYLAGTPKRDYHNGVLVWYDPSPVKPRFYTPKE